MKKDYSNKDLSNADLIGADLTNADLTNANLTDAILVGASLRYADLANAALRNADLRYTDLCNAILDNTNVEGITMNWYSHDLISYRLRLVAETNRQKTIAKHILDNRDQCWNRQVQALNKLGYATEVEWALSVMVSWIKPNDNLPEVLEARL